MPRTTKPVTISLDKPALRKGKRQAKQRGFKQSFSAYVANLIDRDAAALAASRATNGKEEPAHV